MSGASSPLLYDHLARMSDGRGLFEHALHDVPRLEHGYCVDDVARGLVVVVREGEQPLALDGLAEVYLSFLERAVAPNGLVHNRMDALGRWTDEPSTGDWWGRAVWALGTAAVLAHDGSSRARALSAFTVALQQRSPHLKSMVFAALGAAEVAGDRPDHAGARALLQDAMALVPAPVEVRWRWPEPRLTYASAAVAEALIAAGDVLGDPVLTARGFDALAFLLEVETAPGHLSVTGVGGRGPDDTSPQFDQQAIEVAALADACGRALRVSGDARWRDGIRAAHSWFHGVNDAGAWMFDPSTGAGYDGLERNGRNDNRGAESTLAYLSTMQQHRLLVGTLAD